jgi:photosystem II stability/assembly factor-like uncharacterized protein
MKRKIFAGAIVLFFLFSLFSVPGNFQTFGKVSDATCKWMQKLHTSGDDISAVIAVDPVSPNIIYATSSSYLYKSVNYGNSWAVLKNGVPDDYVEAITIDKANHNIVYVNGTKKSGECGLYKTTDGGGSWHRILGAHTWDSKIAIDPKNHNRIYTLNYDHGYFYRSDDGGAHWFQKNLGIKFFEAIAVSTVHTNIIYAGGKLKFVKSTDYGNTWTSPNTTFEREKYFYKFIVDPTNENNIYVEVYNKTTSLGELYYSSNGGTSWSKISGGYYVTDFDIDPRNSSTIYISVWKWGIYKTTDRGAHWTAINNGFQNLSNVDYRAVTVDPVHPTVLYCRVHDPGTNNFKNPRTFRYVCSVDAPTDFTAYFSKNDITFTWKYPSNGDIDYFEIKYKQAGSSTYHLLATNIGRTKRYYKKANFTAINTTFDFVISAVRETERSSWAHDSARHQMKPSITGLVTYSNTASASKLKLTWNKASIDIHADYIEIFRSDPDCSGFFCLPSLVKKIDRGTADFNNGYTYIDGLKFDKQYTIYLDTYDDGGGRGLDTSSDYKTIFIPNIPQHFEAYVDGNKLHFSWDYDTESSSRIDSFKVFMLSPHLSVLGTVAKTGRTLTVNALYTGKGVFIVTAYKGSSFTNSAADSAYVLKKPDAPALSIVNGHIKVQWDKTAIDPNADKVLIYRATSGSPYALLGTVDKNVGEFTDTSASFNVTYYYALKVKREVAGSHADISVYSNTARIKISPPAAPTNLGASANSCSEVALSWTDNASDEEHFVVERKESGGTYAVLATFGPDTTQYTDSSAEGGKTYYYRVKTTNIAGSSAYSNEASVNVPECATAPNEPEDLEVTAVSSSEIDLSWSDNSDNEDGFKIERKISGGSYSEIATVAANVTTYKDTGLSKNTTYYYRVKAFNGKGDSAYSNEAYTTMLKGETVPEAPTGLTGKLKEDGSVVLKWIDNSNNEDGFKIESKVEGGSYSVISSLGANETTYTDYGVQKGKVCWYRVRAFNSKGYSFYSNEVSITILNESNEGKQVVIKLWPDNPNMLVNGVKQEIDPGRGTKPVIISKWGRTVVPIRAIVEALGGTIEWDGIARKVTINFNGTTIYLWIDNPKAKVNGAAKWIDENNHDVKPIIINDRTMLPLRFVAESLGCKVDWDAATRTITITYTP